jgi:hypothetical protein
MDDVLKAHRPESSPATGTESKTKGAGDAGIKWRLSLNPVSPRRYPAQAAQVLHREVATYLDVGS